MSVQVIWAVVFSLCNGLFMYLKDKVRERETEIFHAGLIFKRLQWPRLGHAESKNLEFHLGNFPLLSQVHFQGTELEVEKPELELALVGGC